jgi:hypothetical protein
MCAEKLTYQPDAVMGTARLMRTLLLLVISMVAGAREATARDAECGRERAAMLETIRAYARSDASVLGQQGLSERVLEAMGQTQRHLFIPERQQLSKRPFFQIDRTKTKWVCRRQRRSSFQARVFEEPDTRPRTPGPSWGCGPIISMVGLAGLDPATRPL